MVTGDHTTGQAGQDESRDHLINRSSLYFAEHSEQPEHFRVGSRQQLKQRTQTLIQKSKILCTFSISTLPNHVYFCISVTPTTHPPQPPHNTLPPSLPSTAFSQHCNINPYCFLTILICRLCKGSCCELLCTIQATNSRGMATGDEYDAPFFNARWHRDFVHHTPYPGGNVTRYL